ncbi:stage II sporulation protein R [Paenibacillus apiarius]|uniref:stage II sporulation protein R n=1 Tax=Paenibacillus apiarius TaxID=46240 RepID=UPI00197FB7E7|nr:stage II sporulation protein R [Paenibacillus apiarius]MBN3523943.1 stage II sporulation protein R [Paenibacillus apiarius]
MKFRVFVLGLAFAAMAAGALMRWEIGRVDAAIGEVQEQNAADAIPEDAIRLRVLANSDTDRDQQVKRMVRDVIVEQINGWLKLEDAPQSRDEARALIAKHMDELTQAAAEVLAQQGLPYKAKLELGEVPFPAKWYGGNVYPAGMYEALLVTLGAGEGQNWWCVLFPPLCFIDGDTAQGSANDAATDSASAAASDADDTTEVRFFLWDMIVTLVQWISGLWTAVAG